MSNDVIVKIPVKHSVEPILDLVCASDVEPQPISWLWEGKFAKGKLSIIAGDPGLGKSLITVALAARISCGLRWPVDQSICQKGTIVMLSAEDDLADTIRPRLDAAGADPKKVFVLDMVNDVDQSGETFKRTFSLANDIHRLGEVLSSIPDIQLVTIDPLSAYLNGTDSHNNSDVRGLLAPLSSLAQEHNVAIIGVTHLNKGQGPAVYRAMGSLAFVAAARAAFSVSKDKEDDDRRLVLPIKNNLGVDTGGMAYRVLVAENGAPYIRWDSDPVNMTADDALSPERQEKECPDRDDAVGWLKEELSNGAVEAATIKKQAVIDGHSWRTMRRAKDILGVMSRKSSFEAGWVWELTHEIDDTIEGAQSTPHPKHVGTFGNKWTSSEKSTTYGHNNSNQFDEEYQGAHIPGCGHLGVDTNNLDDIKGEL